MRSHDSDLRARWRIDQEVENSERPRVLLAEDDPEMRKMLAATLNGDGYEVIEAHNGMQLMHYLATDNAINDNIRPIDLVVSDFRMPGRSGLDALLALRSRDWETPFILITAFGDPETHSEARRLGAFAVFDKPFDLDDFRTSVWRLLP